MLSTGASPVQVTHHGGFAAFESPDRKFLYYAKGHNIPGLWRIPIDGGEEVEIISSLQAGYWGYWAMVGNRIYYLDTTEKPRIVFFDIPTIRLPRYSSWRTGQPAQTRDCGLPDARTILYTQLDSSDSDIILAENFR